MRVAVKAGLGFSVVLAAAVVITGTVTGWAVFWHALTGWWTPGWGNLFTVVIAAAAIAVSAGFNFATLRRSAAQTQEARRDATTDKLRNELATFLAELEECRTQSRNLGSRLYDLSNTAEKDSGPGVLDRYIKESQQAYVDTVSEPYLRLAIRSVTIQMLTQTPRLSTP